MQQTGITTGTAPAQRIIIAASTPATRRGAAEVLSGVAASDRTEQREQAHFGRRITDQPGVIGAIDVDGDVAAHTDRRQGAPSSAYLAQHIAQEVAPETPGFDQFQASARAYLTRRDSTMEFFTSDIRLDIRV